MAKPNKAINIEATVKTIEALLIRILLSETASASLRASYDFKSTLKQ